MYVQVTDLRYPKTEHTNETCEDAVHYDAARGLFAVADGVGTAAFAHEWARVLVDYFVRVPLLSDDRFEAEWWLRGAQDLFSPKMAAWGKQLSGIEQNKVREGSQSTLATIRFTHVDTSAASARLLAFGDSCIFIGKPETRQITFFPLDQPEEFERRPVCIPSKRVSFDRDFHRGQSSDAYVLNPGDTIILATDAVALWVVSGGAGTMKQWEAFQQVAAIGTHEAWASFIEECRANGQMIDDDSTALVVHLSIESNAGSFELGATNHIDEQIAAARTQQLVRALQKQDREQLAVALGDPAVFVPQDVPLPEGEPALARRVASALNAVKATLMTVLNSPHEAAWAKLEPVWKEHARTLVIEPCAEQLHSNLVQLGYIEKGNSAEALKRIEEVLKRDDQARIVRLYNRVAPALPVLPPALRARLGDIIRNSSASTAHITPPPPPEEPPIKPSGFFERLNQKTLQILSPAPFLIALGTLALAVLLTAVTQRTPTSPIVPTPLPLPPASRLPNPAITASPLLVATPTPELAIAASPSPIATVAITVATPLVVDARFRGYWESNGGEAAIGKPITPLIPPSANGPQLFVQWFEYARLEIPSNSTSPLSDTARGLLGAERLDQLAATFPKLQPPSPASPNCVFRSETGHQICGAYKTTWENGGEVNVFGLPLSDEMNLGGSNRSIQWFERARFERPANGAIGSVAVAKLGIEVLCAKPQQEQQRLGFNADQCPPAPTQ